MAGMIAGMAVVGVVALLQLRLCARQLRHLARTGGAYAASLIRLRRCQVVIQALLGIGFLWLLALAPPRLALPAMAEVTGIVALQTFAELALAAARIFVVDRRHGFNRTPARRFALDAVQMLALRCGAASILGSVALVLIALAGPWWMLWFVPLAAVLARAGSDLHRLYIEPARRGYAPLPAGELASRLRACRERCGLDRTGLLVEPASARSTHANARAEQALGVRRVILLDTLLERLPPDQVEAVLAHELGHLHCRHLDRRFVLLSLVWTFALAAAAVVAGPGGSETQLLPAIAVLLWPLRFLLQPLVNDALRGWELEADAFAARHVEPRALQRALVALFQANAAAPDSDRGFSRFYESHPPLAHRLALLADT